MNKFYSAIAFILICFSCKPSLYVLQSENDFSIFSKDSLNASVPCRCDDISHYRPDSLYPLLNPLRTIRVNVHFTNSTDKANNHTGEAAVQYAIGLINNANERLYNNVKMNLPIGNSTPVYDPNIRYQLVKDSSTQSGYAIYEHLDDELYYFVNKGRNTNNYRREVLKTYGKDDKTVLNIFAMPHHPDSIASPTYRGGEAGIAIGNYVKVGGSFGHAYNEAWRMGTNLNHEIGHVLGLGHSWVRNDKCDDTPRHPNCWDGTGDAPCDGIVSNNMMDYNNSQMAITPCQIGIMHRNLSVEGRRVRALLTDDYCTYKEENSLIVTDTLHIDRELDLSGDLIIKKGGYLKISCRLHLPKGASLYVEKGGKLELNGAYLHNSCDDSWQGIKIERKEDIVIRQGSSLENVSLNKSSI